MQLRNFWATALVGVATFATARGESTRCYTAFASRGPAHVVTHWSDVAVESCTVTSTVLSTEHEAPTTMTRTVEHTTTVTASPTGRASTLTSTATQTVTVTTATVTSSAVSTDVVPGSTIVTVTTSVGFLPIDVTEPGASDGPIVSSPPMKRYPPPRVQHEQQHHVPSAVTCYRYCEHCATKTVTKCTTAARPTSTVTVTSAKTVITTPGVHASTVTVTDVSTHSVADTVTVVSTTTSTTYTSTSTTYDACATNNIANYISGVPIQGWIAEGTSMNPENYFNTNDTTPEDCCVSAILNPLGAVFLFKTEGTPGYQCSVLVLDTCPSGQASDAGCTNTLASGTDSSTFFGNAYCGTWSGRFEQ